MDWLSPVELIGYVASALVVASLAMTSVVRLRVISLLGSVTFVIYGVLIGAIPILITNVSIAFINIYYLRRELSGRQDLGAVSIDRDAPFLIDFLRSHSRDINQSQPDFQLGPEGLPENTFALLLTREHLPAGAVVGRRVDPSQLDGQPFEGQLSGDTLHIDLDYVMQAYRDSRIGGWLYGDGSKVFSQNGIERLVTKPQTAVHRSYLDRVGFQQRGTWWVRQLD